MEQSTHEGKEGRDCMKRPKIWCDVTCIYCGVTAKNSGYYSIKRINALKEEVENWRTNEAGDAICPNCSQEEQY